MKKRNLYLIASAKKHRVVYWSTKAEKRDGMFAQLEHNSPGQYIPAFAQIDGGEITFTPGDLVVPVPFKSEFEDLCELLSAPYYTGV